MGDLSAIVHFTVVIICKALHDVVLFFVECNTHVPFPSFLLTIIMRSLQLSFCIYGKPDHMVKAEILLVDVEAHCLTILQILPLFHVNICIHVCEDLGKYLVHQGIVNLECTNLVYIVKLIEATPTMPGF